MKLSEPIVGFAYLSLLFICFINIKSLSSQRCGLVPFASLPNETFCSCDLLIEACDVDCCCDINCDASLFSQCLPLPSRDVPNSCSRYVQRNPTSVKISEVYTFSLFCVHKINYVSPNHYKVPRTLCTRDAVDSIPASSYGSHFDQPSPLLPKQTFGTSSYKDGDVLQTLFRDSAGKLRSGILTLPTSDRFCTSRPLIYREESSSSCVSVFTSNLEASCARGSDSPLDAGRYYGNFNLSLVPISNLTGPDPPSLRPTLKRTTCLDIQGAEIGCPSSPDVRPPNFTDGVCYNSIKMVEYEFQLNSTESRLTISKMFVSLTFQDVGLLRLPFTQTFGVRYARPSEPVARRSPSYRVGQPIVAGRLVLTNGSDGETVYSMEVGSNRSTWMTLASSGPDGRCSEDRREPITFGTYATTGCFVDFTLDNISRTCVNVSDRLVKVVLPGQVPLTHAARYANSETNRLNSTVAWLPILNNTGGMLKTFPNDAMTGCSNMVTGLDIEIAYKRTGYVGSLVTELSRVTYNYVTRSTFTFPCPAGSCQNVSRNLTQRAEIRSSVTFVDESSPPEYRKLRKPRPKISLPSDFFYPLN